MNKLMCDNKIYETVIANTKIIHADSALAVKHKGLLKPCYS